MSPLFSNRGRGNYVKVLNRVGNDSVCNMLLCDDDEDDDDDAFALTCDNCMLFDALLFFS